VIAGTVTYGNSRLPGPATRYVPGVLINATGSPFVSDTTGSLGTYSLTGFGSGSYTITPSKTGGVNGAITSFDAALVARNAVGATVFDAAQQTSADVSGDGTVSSFDAAEVARYAVSLNTVIGSSGTWKFNPPSITHGSITSGFAGEDYSALLMGDVSGNWGDPSPFRPAARGIQGPEAATSIAAPHLVTPADNEVLIPVAVQGAANKEIISYEFDLSYDPAVIQPQANPVDLAGTVSSRLSVVANSETPGLLKVAVYGPAPLSGNGVLMNLKFTAVGAPGSVSPLTWERMLLNEGSPQSLTIDGQVELSAAAPNQAEINGKLLTAMGQGVANARVVLTDLNGQSRSIMTNGFGIYRFGGLQVGQTYAISVDSRRLSVTPLTISVTGQVVNVDMIATQ
jgi:hypothetical protein